MNTGAHSASVERIDDMLTYTLVHCQTDPDPEVQALADPLIAERDRLRAAKAAIAVAREAATRSRSILDRLSNKLRESVQDLLHSVRQETGNDFNAPTYRKLFPGGANTVNWGRADVKIQKVHAILTKLGTETKPELKKHEPILQAALTAVEEGVANLRQMRLEQKKSSAALAAERTEWERVYRECYNRLRVHFRDDPRIAERYFPHAASRGATGANEPDDTSPEHVNEADEANPGGQAPASGTGETA
ncbi:MAG: hypothetical protein ACE15D_15085 [Candidatus Eisenbacteria bacterium]